MSRTYILEPEVPGNLGVRTQMDRSTQPPTVVRLHFVFDGWLGDQLVESFPCYLITTGLAESLASAGVTGFKLADAEIEESTQFKEIYPDRLLPPFKWMKVVGRPGLDDIYATSDHGIVVSQKAFDVIQETNPAGLEFRESDNNSGE